MPRDVLLDATLDGYAAALTRLFPVTLPETAVWTDASAIRAVLVELAACGGTLASAPPDGGQALLRAVSPGEEPGTIELATAPSEGGTLGARYLLRPERLTLETYEGHALTWLRLSAQHIGSVNDAAPLALAEHQRIRVKSGAAFVLFAEASPLARAAVDRSYASWTEERLREFVSSLQQTLLAETG